MSEDKFFLTYNQQMRKLRNDKGILYAGSSHKKILIPKLSISPHL